MVLCWVVLGGVRSVCKAVALLSQVMAGVRNQQKGGNCSRNCYCFSLHDHLGRNCSRNGCYSNNHHGYIDFYADSHHGTVIITRLNLTSYCSMYVQTLCSVIMSVYSRPACILCVDYFGVSERVGSPIPASQQGQGFQPCCEAGIGEPTLSDA